MSKKDLEDLILDFIDDKPKTSSSIVKCLKSEFPEKVIKHYLWAMLHKGKLEFNPRLQFCRKLKKESDDPSLDMPPISIYSTEDIIHEIIRRVDFGLIVAGNQPVQTHINRDTGSLVIGNTHYHNYFWGSHRDLMAITTSASEFFKQAVFQAMYGDGYLEENEVDGIVEDDDEDGEEEGDGGESANT